MSDNTSRGTEVGGIGLVTVILALLFLFVWPGPLRYDYAGSKAEVKIDRLTHQVWDYDSEWKLWEKR